MNFAVLALASVVMGLVILLLLWRLLARPGGGEETARLRLLLEQNLAVQRTEAETTRRDAAGSERALGGRLEALRLETKDAIHGLAVRLAGEQAETRAVLEHKLREHAEITRTDLASGARAVADRLETMRLESRDASHALSVAMSAGQTEARLLLEQKLRELAENNMAKLAEIERQVNEQLHLAVEKQMESSFQRVIDQFTAVQKAMGDVQAVTAQIGDLRRVFSNVRTRGGWGETHLRALLDDMLPVGAYEMNRKLRENSDEVVEFVVHMPMKGDTRLLMAIDCKFPMEDYERLLDAAARDDSEAERQAKRGREQRIRLEAKKIAEKYIVPPVTVEFAVLYLPTDGLFAEVARMPGLLDEIGRTTHVTILGPSLLPALLRTIHLGFMTMALEQKTGEIRHLLGATHTEMLRMDEVLEKLAGNAGRMSKTIDDARQRTRVVRRKLRGLEAVEASEAATLFAPDEISLIAVEEGEE